MARGGIELALERWRADPFYRDRVFRGRVADLGGQGDPFIDYAHYFPNVESVTTVDQNPLSGRACTVADLNTWAPGPEYDCIIASHTLEHLHDPFRCYRRWEGGLTAGGHLLVIVPSWNLYERGIWPSRWNPDHKTAWVMNGADPRTPFQHNVLQLPKQTRVIRAQLLDEGYTDLPDHHQTLDGSCECAIEIVSVRPG